MTLKHHHPHNTHYTCMPNPVTSCCSVETETNHLSTLKPPHALAILPSPSLTITNGLAFQVQLLSTHNNRLIPSIPKSTLIAARLIAETIQTNLKIDSYVGVAVQKENKQSWECIFGLLAGWWNAQHKSMMHAQQVSFEERSKTVAAFLPILNFKEMPLVWHIFFLRLMNAAAIFATKFTSWRDWTM